MEITFRSLDLVDLPKTIALCNICFDEITPYEHAEKVFLETMTDPNNIYINGIYNGEVIAHAKLTIIKTIYEPMGSYGIINHLCVHPDFRRKDLATHLLDVIFKVAKERNCKSIELWSKNFRIAAHSCYKKYGFEQIDAGFFSKKVG